MRQPLLILVALVPLAHAECPPILQGVEIPANAAMTTGEFQEVLDTACGKRNYTSAFWSPTLYQTSIINLVACEQKAYEKNCTKFKPLADSLKAQFASLKEESAKTYVKDFFKIQRRTFKGKFHAGKIFMAIFSSLSFNFGHTLPFEAHLELSQAYKNAVEYKETSEMKKERIYMAMKAIERVGTTTRNDKLGELFAEVFGLTRDNFFLLPPFVTFIHWAEKEWKSTEIGLLEILPAVETLYVQYASLNNTEAKDLVKWAIASYSMKLFEIDEKNAQNVPLPDTVERFTSRMNMTELAEACPSGDIIECFHDLPEEARSAITTAFPELFEYLSNDIDLSKWASVKPSTVHEEQPAEGSGLGTLEEQLALHKKKMTEKIEAGEGSGMILLFH